MEVREGLQGSDILGETLKMTRNWTEAVGGVEWPRQRGPDVREQR